MNMVLIEGMAKKRSRVEGMAWYIVINSSYEYSFSFLSLLIHPNQLFFNSSLCIVFPCVCVCERAEPRCDGVAFICLFYGLVGDGKGGDRCIALHCLVRAFILW